MSWLLILTILALAANAFASIGSLVLNEIAWHDLEDYCKNRQQPKRFSDIFELRDQMEVGCGLLHLIATVVLSTSLLFFLLSYRDTTTPTVYDMLVYGILLCFALLLTNHWIPWAVTQISAVPFLYRTWRFWGVFSLLGWPLVIGRQIFEELFSRASGNDEPEESEEEAFEEEILSMVSEGEHDGYLEANTRDMIEGVMELDDKTVGDIMTPRNKVNALNQSTSWDEMMEFVIESGRTRIPIYDESLDQVVGLLFAKDLLRESRLSKRRPLQKLLRDPLEVPETIMLDEMLKTFLRGRTHMAIVKDEYGAVAGVVTIEDVLEEIVGEIVDETDEDISDEITFLNDRQAEVQGTMHISVLNHRMGIELPEDDEYATVSGLIMNKINEIPRSGYEVSIGNVKLNILDATRRQIKAVRVTIVSEND